MRHLYMTLSTSGGAAAAASLRPLLPSLRHARSYRYAALPRPSLARALVDHRPPLAFAPWVDPDPRLAWPRLLSPGPGTKVDSHLDGRSPACKIHTHARPRPGGARRTAPYTYSRPRPQGTGSSSSSRPPPHLTLGRWPGGLHNQKSSVSLSSVLRCALYVRAFGFYLAST